MEQVIYSKGDVIFRENDVESCMYDIVAGKVGIYANYGAEEEKLLTELEAGMFFGEMGMIDAMPRSATAVALEDETKLCRIDEESFDSFLEGDPEKVLAMMQHMSNRIRGLTADYLSACQAVSEAAASGKKEGWFKSHMKKFLDDYQEYAAYAAAQPTILYGSARPTLFMQYDPMQFHF